MTEPNLSRRTHNILNLIRAHSGFPDREAIKAAIESGELQLTIYRHCGQKTAADIAAWAGATIPPDSKRKKRSTIELLGDKLRKAILAKAKGCQHALVAEMAEADGYAIYVIQPDGIFHGEGYAEGNKWEDLHLYELGYILEYGEDKEQPEVVM